MLFVLYYSVVFKHIFYCLGSYLWSLDTG